MTATLHPHVFQASGPRYERTLREHDQANWVHPFDRSDDERLAGDRRASRASLLAGRVRREGALSIGCLEHQAVRGQWCWDSSLSGVRGFCSDRWNQGVQLAGRVIFGSGVAR